MRDVRMGVLNRLFRSTGTLAKKAEQDEEAILKSWNDYKETVREKEKIIRQLPALFGERKAPIARLQPLLDLELIDIRASEKEDNDLISDIQGLEREKKIQRVHRLESALAYAETKYKYAYELLRHLYATVKAEAVIVKELVAVSDLRKYRKILSDLQSEFAVEMMILKKIEARRTFHQLFLDLIKGEQVVQGLGAKEKRMAKHMQNLPAPIGGLTDQWVMGVFEKLEDKVHEAVAEGTLEYHPDVGFEFVNGSAFVDLVREVIQTIRKKKVSEEMMQAFVHLFREKYNND